MAASVGIIASKFSGFPSYPAGVPMGATPVGYDGFDYSVEDFGTSAGFSGALFPDSGVVVASKFPINEGPYINVNIKTPLGNITDSLNNIYVVTEYPVGQPVRNIFWNSAGWSVWSSPLGMLNGVNTVVFTLSNFQRTKGNPFNIDFYARWLPNTLTFKIIGIFLDYARP